MASPQQPVDPFAVLPDPGSIAIRCALMPPTVRDRKLQASRYVGRAAEMCRTQALVCGA